MRTRHRFALVASFSILGAGLTVAACSGDDGNTAGLFDAGPDTADNDSTATADAGGGNDTGSVQDTSTQDVIKTEASTRDTGVPNVVDGGDAGAVPCIVGGTLETEPNDSAGTANVLAGTVCGTITPVALDLTDFYKFTLQPATTTMTLYFSGNVKLTVKVNGQTVVLTPQSSPAVPFVQGMEYSVQVESNQTPATNKQNYTITLEEK
ncbi:MAG: hypothetical protein JWM74_1346 [Myxococcaceae bacterium]|nr:hypothetical protein [Myxococcaceae bacterium]